MNTQNTNNINSIIINRRNQNIDLSLIFHAIDNRFSKTLFKQKEYSFNSESFCLN